MISLSIRKLDDLVCNQSQARAMEYGVSVEDEGCEIAAQAVPPSKSIVEIFREYFGPENGIDLESFVREVNPPIDLLRIKND